MHVHRTRFGETVTPFVINAQQQQKQEQTVRSWVSGASKFLIQILELLLAIRIV